MSKDQHDAKHEPRDHSNQDKEDDRTKPLLERLKALEVTLPVPPPVPPYLKDRYNRRIVLCHVTLDSSYRN